MGLWYQGCRVQGPSVAPFLLRWPLTIPWSLADFDAHEDVHFFHDRSTGLRAIIAIHSTHLGPAAGGARYWCYAGDDEPLIDALRLSRGMRSEVHTSELQSLMRISYAVFCLKKKNS